jgi:hypothetical protein
VDAKLLQACLLSPNWAIWSLQYLSRNKIKWILHLIRNILLETLPVFLGFKIFGSFQNWNTLSFFSNIIMSSSRLPWIGTGKELLTYLYQIQMVFFQYRVFWRTAHWSPGFYLLSLCSISDPHQLCICAPRITGSCFFGVGIPLFLTDFASTASGTELEIWILIQELIVCGSGSESENCV